jgi:conjugative relaxase-like TrwC/TraI family protein
VAVVLRVATIRAGGGAYYLEVAEGTGTGIEPAGRWMGAGPAAFQLGGTVGAADLEAVLAGRDPDGGQVLGRARAQVQVAALDMTFSAPKSVSLLQALGDPEVARAVARGHRRAVAAAMTYVEHHALAVRRPVEVTPGQAPVRLPTAVEGMTAAGFVHHMSRSLDPHLHSHVVVANVGRGAEGTWSALDRRGVYAHASATDALYHAHLRFELTRALGVAWNPLDRGRADMAGIGPEARREFSRRAAEIAAHLAERVGPGHRGDPGRRASAVAGLATRAAKNPEVSADDVRSQWRERAVRVGLGPRRLEAVLDRTPRRSGPHHGALEDGALPAAVGDALGALHRPLARRDVVRAWGRALPAGAPAEAIEEAADHLLQYLAPDPGSSGRRDGPGVAERRHDGSLASLGKAVELGSRSSVRHREQAELARVLGRRVGVRERSSDRQPDLGLGLG